MIKSILRLRPFLWIAGLLLLAILVSFTWEHQTSYDDGGIGTAAFVFIALFAILGSALGLNLPTSIAVALLLLIATDFAIKSKLKR